CCWRCVEPRPECVELDPIGARVVDDLFAEHCLADPIVVYIPERITGLKLRPGCFIDIIDNLEFERLERTRMPERAHREPPCAQRRSRGREKPRPDSQSDRGFCGPAPCSTGGERSGAGPNQGTDPGCAPNSLLVGGFQKREARLARSGNRASDYPARQRGEAKKASAGRAPTQPLQG